jgi:carbon monoxide dehydrogenase subunit G
MPAIVESIEIARRPEDVFSYATEFSHFSEWQGGVVSTRREDDGPIAVGSRAVVTRRVGPRTLAGTEEITELHPPRAWSVRGAGGRLTAIVKGAIEPLEDGERSRVTIAFDLEGRGIGKLLLPLVRRQVRKQLPRNAEQLKEMLEPSSDHAR